MVHHRFEKYNPVVWIGRTELTTPRADISGMYGFVFQPEKRQEEARKLCQAEQIAFGAHVKYEGSSHRDFTIGNFADDNQPRLTALMQRIHLASELTDPHPVDEGLRQEELGSRSAASSSQNWQSAQWWWSN